MRNQADNPWRVSIVIAAIDPLILSNFHPNRCEFPPTLLTSMASVCSSCCAKTLLQYF
jgi:hypothetical protein